VNARLGQPTETQLSRAESAAWGATLDANPARAAERPRMRLVSWKPMAKGSLRLRYGRAAGRAQAHRQLVMDGESLNEMLTAHFRRERAIDAARRFISRNVNATLRTSEVVEFLRRRREQLPEADIEHCATEAVNRWLSSRADRFRSRRDARGRALDDGKAP
jgi:hypothetical protein